jgi:large subunit ribosomal protein L4
MKADLYNMQNEKVGTVELPDAVFGVAWKPELVKQMIAAFLANQRRPWAHAKTRAEVRGGGKKPWRQKGTGRARHGSIRSPLWSGGGKAHGPLKERDYSQKVNAKMRRIALFSVLSRKLKDGELRIVQNLTASEPKTKSIAKPLASLVQAGPREKKMDVLLVPGTEEKNLFRAARNIPKTLVADARSLNVYDVLNHKHVLVDESAVPVVLKHYAVK